MKKITNWENATVCDLESDNLLEEATKIHVVSCEMQDGRRVSIKGDDHERIRSYLRHHIDNKIPVVYHNGKSFDVPLFEKLLGVDLSELMVIDTLALSWYLNTNRKRHGLDSFLEDYGIEKPKVDDWENLTYEEYEHRCSEDVAINKALWEDFKGRLVDIYTKAKDAIDNGMVGGTRMENNEEIYIDRYVGTSTVSEYIDRFLTFLMYKMDTVRLREATRFKVDVASLLTTQSELTELIEAAQVELEGVMPKVPKFTKKKKPKNPFLKNGNLSKAGQAWNDLIDRVGETDRFGNAMVEAIDGENLKVLSKYEEPNINSSDQIKKWLFDNGWKPETFKFVKDEKAQQAWADSGFKRELKPEMRKIPQLNKDGGDGKELCHSVVKLADKIPEIMAYSKFTMVKHRLDTVKGFLRDMTGDGYLRARVGGFTNTLRDQHRELVNLPGVGKPYGKNLRGALVAEDGCILMGSDLASLEDRVKHHFMLPHDPEYVKTMMTDDYDPHLFTALSAGMISQEDFDNFMAGNKESHVTKARAAGKSTNYSSVYGAGAETIARAAGLSSKEGKELFDGYWKLNWAVNAIADEQHTVVDDKGGMWLVNPINGFCYSLRKENDKFSTLCQGTGSFFFDLWVDGIQRRMHSRFGVKRLSFAAHDECVIQIKDSVKGREILTEMINDSLEEVNETYMLRRSLGCDIQWGKSYAEIH